VPDAARPPLGCMFHPRCSRAFEVCGDVMAVAYQVLPNLALQLGVDNLFDQHYEDVVGFPAPGAVVRGGISASL